MVNKVPCSVQPFVPPPLTYTHTRSLRTSITPPRCSTTTSIGTPTTIYQHHVHLVYHSWLPSGRPPHPISVFRGSARPRLDPPLNRGNPLSVSSPVSSSRGELNAGRSINALFHRIGVFLRDTLESPVPFSLSATPPVPRGSPPPVIRPAMSDSRRVKSQTEAHHLWRHHPHRSQHLLWGEGV